MDSPLCEACDSPMEKEGVRPLRPGFDAHVFRCPDCGFRRELPRDTRFASDEDR